MKARSATVHQWQPASIGLVMSLAGIAALVAQTPAGALIDRTKAKRALLVFAACCALFHLANAAMLPLVSQKLSQVNLHLATPLTSACIVAAQLVMVPMALLVGAKAEQWGRKPFLLAGFSYCRYAERSTWCPTTRSG